MEMYFSWDVFFIVLREFVIVIPAVFIVISAVALLVCWKVILLRRFFMITFGVGFACLLLWFSYVYSVKIEMEMADRFVHESFIDIEKGNLPVFSESVEEGTREWVDQWLNKDLDLQKIQYYGTSMSGDPYYLPYDVVFGDGTVLYCKLEIERTTLLRRDIRIKVIAVVEDRQLKIMQ